MADPGKPSGDNPDGLDWGLYIHRYHEPREWPKQLNRVSPEHRPVAEQYLRDIAARMKVVRRLKQQREQEE